MKIAIINDTHFGARADSQIFLDYFLEFFEEQFIPYLKDNKINRVLHLGDFMDRRKFVNFQTLNQTRERLLEVLYKENIEVDCLLGNHDTYFRNTNDINSLQELFGNRYINFRVHENPAELEFDGYTIAMIPWINKENKEDTFKFLQNSSANMVCGHFELNGYQVMPGMRFEGGMDDDILKKFELVLSGHFHTKQIGEHVQYLGTQYQITFADLNQKKGFHVFDTESRTLDFIENTKRMFYALTYDDKDTSLTDELLHMDPTQYENSYIKVYVKNKNKPYTFDRFLDRLYDASVANITLVEEIDQIGDLNEEDVLDMAQDTVTLIGNEIDAMEDIDNPGKLKKIIRDLYMEALSQ
jgi:DNA repair exonuclease SbcCD nuclease subunit